MSNRVLCKPAPRRWPDGDGTSKQAVIFPGVPDRWLVTRFNPAPAANTSSSARTWRAWIVDSRAKTATPLESWTAPAPSVIDSVHPLPGLLPSAKDIGYPGWGLWDGAQTDFDPTVTSAIYYPSAPQRFGFYDDLGGQSDNGSVSYTVIGWYSITANDPLFMSTNRQRQIADWLWDDSHGTVRPLGTSRTSEAGRFLHRPSLRSTNGRKTGSTKGLSTLCVSRFRWIQPMPGCWRTWPGASLKRAIYLDRA